MIAAHDALKEAAALEPALDREGLPYDSAAWLVWHERVHVPASRRLRHAVDNLSTELGESVPRHPFGFRPLCERIIREGVRVA